MSASATESETSNDPILGKVIDGCKIQRKLGQGGMGVVYLAEHETLKQQFVIKILNPALVGAEDTVERFFREAQACAQLNHTGIVAIQNVGQEGEYYFIRMEYIEGKTLEETIKTENQIEWRRSVQIIIDTADSLSHAHQKGMIHRDIKPENIMLTPEGHVKVMDFGLAKHVHSNAKVSVTGQIVGTPFFMSPEQAGGKPTDARSDIYSLGVTLYYMVTGVKPFNGKNLQEIFLKHFFYAPESPKIYNGDLPESLCEVVKKCLKKKKKERYQSAKELSRDLKAVLDDPDAVVAKDEPALESQAPEAAAGATDEYGKTIRAKTGQEEGDRTVVAGGKTQEASTGEEADRTVRVGGATSDGTVKVDGEQGPTVRVEEDSNDPTVAVKNRANTTGRLGESVATVSFQDGKSVVINTQQLDADHPAAGLDLPTAVLEAGATQTPGDTTGQPTRAGAARRASQKRLMVVGALVLGPILVLGGMQVMAGQKLASLQEEFNELGDRKDPAEWLAFAQKVEETQVVGDRQLYDSMATLARERATMLEAKRKEELDAKVAEDKRLESERQKQAQRDDLQKNAGVRQKQLEDLRTARDWPKFTEAALAFFKDYNELLPDLTRPLLLPVQITTDPPGAELFVNSAATAEVERTPGIAWVPPTREFKIKIRKRGFDEETFAGDAKGFIEEKRDLKRHVVRELSLGTIQRPIGTKQVAEARLPVSDPVVDPADGGTIYYVGIDGVLYAMGLRAKVQWPVRPKDHRVGCYGDPTPAPAILLGQVVIVGSALGTVSAHRPSNDGQRIWKDADVGSPVTSAPALGSNGKEKVACVGTAAGDAVFVDVTSGQILWRYRTENMVVSTPLVVGERAYIGSTDNRVHAVDWSKKQMLGTIDVGDDVITGPFALGRLLVVGTRDGVGHVLDVTDPSAIRRVATLGKPSAMARDQGLVCVADRVYLASGRQVQAFGVGSNGAVTEAWSAPFECPAQVLRPTAEGDVLYVGAQNGILYALDRNTGQVLWKHAIPGGSGTITSSPFVVDNELFVIADGRVVVLEAE